jgi:beta-lactamase superfamily II metal-dependent hydrolase
MPYRVVQPWGKDRGREATEISSWPTVIEAFEEIDRYAARTVSNGLPGDYIELLVVDENGNEVLRTGRTNQEATIVKVPNGLQVTEPALLRYLFVNGLMTISNLQCKAVVLLVLCLLHPCVTFADVIVPTDDVSMRVVVRSGPSSQTAAVGSLRPGEQVELVGSVPNWHEVRLANGQVGFVSKRWTRVITEGTPPPGPAVAAPTFTIDVVDVGTGLAVLVRGPDFTLVYDAGSNDDLGRGADNRMLAFLQLVVPSLSQIDHIVLSHPHRDHVELLPDLVAQYQVRHVWDSGRLNDICGYRAFLTAVRNEPGVQYHNALRTFGMSHYAFDAGTCYGARLPAETITLLNGTRIDETPVPLGQAASMTVLHADGAQHPSANENSLVIRLDLGGTRVLLVGDAEAGGRQAPSVAPRPNSIEGSLITCCASEVSAAILIAGHHGSKTSSRHAFLDAVGASIFVVSSGPMRYGQVTLPDAEIVSELTGRGQVFRTDLNDQACATSPAKIGPDADGKPGGCDDVRIVLSGPNAIAASYFRGAEP